MRSVCELIARNFVELAIYLGYSAEVYYGSISRLPAPLYLVFYTVDSNYETPLKWRLWRTELGWLFWAERSGFSQGLLLELLLFILVHSMDEKTETTFELREPSWGLSSDKLCPGGGFRRGNWLEAHG